MFKIKPEVLKNAIKTARNAPKNHVRPVPLNTFNAGGNSSTLRRKMDTKKDRFAIEVCDKYYANIQNPEEVTWDEVNE